MNTKKHNTNRCDLTYDEAVTIFGKEIIEQLNSLDCDFAQDHPEGLVKFKASVSCHHENEEVVITAIYYVLQEEYEEADELSDIDWKKALSCYEIS